MPKYTIILLHCSITWGALTGWAQYTPSSTWVKEPEKILPYLLESADFWIAAYDPEYGGFFSNVGIDGTPLDTDTKAALIQSRNAYAMCKAFMVSGEERYLSYADGALRFMYAHAWDEEFGGWIGINNRTGGIGGQPWEQWANDDKWSFWQHYQILGINAYLEATNDTFHWAWHEKANEINDRLLWDNTPGRQGYYERANHDWTQLRNKGFTPTVDAMTTNATYNYLLTRNPFRRDRMKAVADNISDYLVGSMNRSDVKAGFCSQFTTDWKVKTESTVTSIGHFVKTSWCLGRAYLLTGNETYKTGLQRILDQFWSYKKGTTGSMWIHDVGTCRGDINWRTGNTSKIGDWWTLEQCFTSGMMNWYITRKPEYLQIADQAIDFFMKYYYDYANGEVFAEVDADGTVLNDKKGDMFKGGYHSIELMYYVYLYGNLFYHRKPITLYYHWQAPAQAPAKVAVWPVEIEDEHLKVTSVETKDGVILTSYDPDRREITIPAGMSGTFRVVLENMDQPPAPNNVWGVQRGSSSGWLQAFPGWVYYRRDWYPWSYSAALGWVYSFSSNPGPAWHYLPARQDIFFTGPGLYPNAFSAVLNDWVVLQP